jgi:hypothetical protein
MDPVGSHHPYSSSSNFSTAWNSGVAIHDETETYNDSLRRPDRLNTPELVLDAVRIDLLLHYTPTRLRQQFF